MKGSPIITFRLSPILLRQIAAYLERRGEQGHVNAMDRSAFIVKAIEEKLDKHARAAKKRPTKKTGGKPSATKRDAL